MSLLYLDIFSGISGDMFLGAMLDLGVELPRLKSELTKLALDGYHLHVGREQRSGIEGVKLDVKLSDPPSVTHRHSHEAPLGPPDPAEKWSASDRTATPHEHAPEAHSHSHEPHGHGPHGHEQHGHEPHEHGPHRHEHGPRGHEHQGVERQAHAHHHHEHEHEREHEHHHEHEGQLHAHGAHHHGSWRDYAEIRRLIAASSLSSWVQEKATAVFHRIAVAEGKIHGKPPEQVHFHEVGAVDSIVDIVGGCIALEALGKPRVVSAPAVEGTGWVWCAHGRFPTPTAATLEILGARGIAISQCEEPHELITPTGAALLAEFAEEFGPMRGLVARRIGYGIGTRHNKTRPNVLRAILGEAEK